MEPKASPNTTDEPQPADDLERARRKRAAVKANHDWINSVGMIEDTPEEREAWALGEAWRRAQTDP